jgi:hypothetical protein
MYILIFPISAACRKAKSKQKLEQLLSLGEIRDFSQEK